MDFELSEEQTMLVDNVTSFVKKDSPVARFRGLRNSEQYWDRQVWAQMGELGWLGIAFPESVGGLGFGFVDVALILERLGTTLVPEPYVPSVILAGLLLRDAGSAAQHAEVLAPMIAGQTSLALAYAEEQSRHDVCDVATTAKKQGGDYVLSGKKRFVLNGMAADRILVSARTSGGQREAAGVSLFVLDPTLKGVKRTPAKTMDGQLAAMLELDSVKLPASALVGAEGSAAPLLERAVDYGAAAACAEGSGIIETVLEMTREYLCDRVQFGVKIGSFQSLQHRCVDMFVEAQLSKSTMILAALKVDDADPVARQRAISTAKVQLTMGGQFVTRQGIQLHGGIGVTDEHDVGLYFKRMNVLNSLFGDEQHHLARFSSLPGFEKE
jgi:alkylation response protein AidB-like acyl-CoA dehydrogenase